MNVLLHNNEIKAKVWAALDSIEESALDQIKAMMSHPMLFKHVAIMPDVHAGIGATIGSVIPIKSAVIPSAVGVDAGCGMCTLSTGLKVEDISDRFDSIYRGIKENIPVGNAHRQDSKLDIVYQYIPDEFLAEIKDYENTSIWNQNKIVNQLGTLGGGNHFIELQKDADGIVHIMIHSGSRNIGNKITRTYIDEAKKLANAPQDLEYLGVDSILGKEYIQHVDFAVRFAYMNRLVMMEAVKQVLVRDLTYAGRTLPTFSSMINIHHNYVNRERHFGEDIWVHRKGATRVRTSITGIIPGSMGSASYIVTGTNNDDSYNSCSHGAGRTMSRTAARGKFNRKDGGFKSEGMLTVEDFKKDMEGIYTKDVDRSHLDEAPRAYKNIDTVMANQTDLVDIITKLTPVMNVKG